MKRAITTIATVVVLATGCGDGVVDSGSSGEGETSSTAAPTTVVPTEPGVATDEPCSRALAAGALPEPGAYLAEDLERMVLTRDDLGGLAAFDSDIGRHGYQGNRELETIEVHPPGLCDDLARYGRITGFGTAYLMWDDPSRRVLFSVHLFRKEADAQAWTHEFVADMAATAGTPDGPAAFSARPLDELGDGAQLVEHVGPEGTRTWALFVRGPVVGWVVDLHQAGDTTIDVLDAAVRMAARIDGVAAEVATREASGLPAAHLLSVPLPLAELGERFAGLEWNHFFGGCSDDEERGAIAGEEEAEDARRFGRVIGCAAMYDDQDDSGHAVERVWSAVTVFRDAAGASADLADGLAEIEAAGGQRFDVGRIGDEAVATRVAAENWTRVSLRLGNLVTTVSISDREPRDPGAAEAEAAELALELYDRLVVLRDHASVGS